MNEQKPEAPCHSGGAVLDVHSIFPTIQGEGPFSGHPAVFVRLGGCNLRCPGCDTEYTVGRTKMHYDFVVERVLELMPAGGDLVVVTGGEPFRQSIGVLCAKLVNVANYRVQVETNGTVKPDRRFHDLKVWRRDRVTVVCSPKTKRIDDWHYEHANAFKYIVDHRYVDPADGLPTVALDHEAGRGVARPRLGAPVYLTPFATGDEQMDANNRTVMVACAMQYGYVAGLQIHKILGVE